MNQALKTVKNGLDEVLRLLLLSTHPLDQRKAVDLVELVSLSRSEWAGKFKVVGAVGGEDRSLGLLCLLSVPGLLWDGNAAVPTRSSASPLACPTATRCRCRT